MFAASQAAMAPAQEPSEKPHTLEEYSYDHFRPPPSHTSFKTLPLSPAHRRRHGDLWQYSKEPLKQPLLKKLLGKEELSQNACLCFTDILASIVKTGFEIDCHIGTGYVEIWNDRNLHYILSCDMILLALKQ